MEQKRFSLPSFAREILDSQSLDGRSISFFHFVRLALYHPTCGYYQKPRERVGKGKGTDFYTATSLGAIWYELIFDALLQLLGEEKVKHLHFVELGAEPYQSPVAFSPFRSHQRILLNEDLAAIQEPFFLFANEILDAQPFRKFKFQDGVWQEWGVFWDDEAIWEGPFLTSDSQSLRILEGTSPEEGDVCDLSTGAIQMMEALSQNPYLQGLLFFDYGKDLATLLETSPQGTSRAYYEHTVKNSILENFSEMDITHHVAWDEIIKVLDVSGLQAQLKSQESFFVNYAPNIIKKYLTTGEAQFSEARQALKALIHPLYFGQKFQALFANKPLNSIRVK